MSEVEGRLQPAKLWHYVVGPYVSPVRISPRFLVAAIISGRHTPQLIESYLAVTETAKILNRLMGRQDFDGVPPEDRKCAQKRK